MATIIQQPAASGAERRFFVAMAAWMVVTIFVGFAPTYYLSPWVHTVTSRGVSAAAALTPLVHLHGAVFTSWMVLFCIQVTLIASGRSDIHQKLGIFSAFLAPVMVVIGYLTATGAARAGSSPPGWDDKAFLLIPLTSLALFGGFFIAALIQRQHSNYHKRFMLLATMALLLPALARIVRYFEVPLLPVGVLGGLVVLNLYPLALIAFDLKQTGRVHPATVWGATLLFLAWPTRLLLGSSSLWQNLAETLIS